MTDDLRQVVTNVRVKRRAELSTDHHLAVGNVRMILRDRRKLVKPKSMTRIKWEQLSKDYVQRNFCKKIDEKFKQLPSRIKDIETEWV